MPDDAVVVPIVDQNSDVNAPVVSTGNSSMSPVFTPMPARFKEAVRAAPGLLPTSQEAPAVSQESPVSAGEVEIAQVPVGMELPSQGIELEKSPEVPPEVESWVQEVGQKVQQAPKEVKVVQFQGGPTPSATPQEEVVVLPVTETVLKKGLQASVADSIRWLSEWCLKMIKKFHGMIVYNQAEEG